MTEAQCRRVFQEAILPRVEGEWRIEGRYLVRLPIEHTYRAILLDRRSDPEEFAVTRFVVPVYLELPDRFSWSMKFLDYSKDRDTWPFAPADEQNTIAALRKRAKRHCGHWLARFDSLEFVASGYAKAFSSLLSNLACDLEAEAGALVLLGEKKHALDRLDRAISWWPEEYLERNPYARGQVRLRRSIAADFDAARRQFRAWRENNFRRFKLARFGAPA